MADPIHLISLGAGVQSSTLALMAAAGEITPMPTAAIFADTKAEPQSVYTWLDWLEKQLPFPVHRVSKGNLTDESLRVRISGTSSESYLGHSVPAYTVNADSSKGTMFRICTDKHKLVPLRKATKALAPDRDVVMWIGISSDEIQRMKPSRDPRITHRWPLIDARMSRHDCLKWMEAHGYPKPPRSACVYCPYHSDREWLRLRRDEHAEFQRAVEYERNLQSAFRQVPRLTSTPYLHADRVPLDQVQFVEDRQTELFTNECEGMCGV